MVSPQSAQLIPVVQAPNLAPVTPVVRKSPCGKVQRFCLRHPWLSSRSTGAPASTSGDIDGCAGAGEKVHVSTECSLFIMVYPDSLQLFPSTYIRIFKFSLAVVLVSSRIVQIDSRSRTVFSIGILVAKTKSIMILRGVTVSICFFSLAKWWTGNLQQLRQQPVQWLLGDRWLADR